VVHFAQREKKTEKQTNYYETLNEMNKMLSYRRETALQGAL